MATAHRIRDLITETASGTVRPRVPREVREGNRSPFPLLQVDGRVPDAVFAIEVGVGHPM